MRFVILLLTLVGQLLGVPAAAQAASDTPTSALEQRAGCESCRIRVESLAQPVKLAGKWLFTRDDLPHNKDADLDTRDWRLAKTPGPWKGVYEDKRNFSVGWYRGNFVFAPSLMGQEAVLMVNAYMGRVRVYVDGMEVYERPHDINVDRYYSVQPIPVRFKVTHTQHVVAIRVETPLMTGIYQLPFEMRAYDPHDLSLVAHQIWGGEVRTVAAYVIAGFGFFFLLVFAKTRHSMYLVTAAAAILTFPFLAAPGDYLLRVFEPESMLYLHYTGLVGMFFFYMFVQYFHKFTPGLNWVLGTTQIAVAIGIATMLFKPDLDLFQALRSAAILLGLINGVFSFYTLACAVRNRRKHAVLLLAASTTFTSTGVNDVLLALGVINSVSMIFVGITVFLCVLLYVASTSFANTFVENKRLVKDLKGMNDNLEHLVADRTRQLQEKTHDINNMLQNMPQGVLTILPDNRIHAEYSAYLESILETCDIAGRDLIELVFAKSNLGADTVSQVAATASSCIGEDRMNFEFNAHLLATELSIAMPGGNVKTLDLSWSPICNDGDVIEKLMLCVRDVTALKRLEAEAGQQKLELEVIGEVLRVSQEKFHAFIDGALGFTAENIALLDRNPPRTVDTIDLLFRNLHTIKGNARTHGLLHLTHLVHEAEQAIQDQRIDPTRPAHEGPAWDPMSLREQSAVVRSLVEEYARVNDNVLGRKGPGRRGDAEKFLLVDKAQIHRSLQLLATVDTDDAEAMRGVLSHVGSTLNQIGAEPLDDILAGVIGSLPSLAAELGKATPEVHIESHGLLVRKQISGMLQNLFTHLLRNSIDHGLETPEARLAAGKPAVGRIEIELQVDESQLRLSLRDDGRGMALGRLRERAIQQHRFAADAEPTPHEIAELIFLSGFSTAEKVTEVSGRGVGMDAVRKFVQREGGHIRVRFLESAQPSAALPDFLPFELRIDLPEKFAASAAAATSFQTWQARMRAQIASARTAVVESA